STQRWFTIIVAGLWRVESAVPWASSTNTLRKRIPIVVNGNNTFESQCTKQNTGSNDIGATYLASVNATISIPVWQNSGVYLTY
ncbi:MAG: hypothetical protein ACKPKO_64300, partial [Candidatus Fonsibacter sp.]